MKKGTAVLLLVVVAGLFLGLGYFWRGTKLTSDNKAAPTAANNAPVAPPADKTVCKVAVGNSPAKGPDDALITIVEFSDFQCPFCGRVVATLKQIEDNYRGKVRFVFKNNPLPFHQNAPLAAEAAMAAADQGKFWEMHDKLFANQQALERPALEKYAQEIGINLDKFKVALDTNAHKDAIEADKTLAATLGANGTPSFFINGRSLRGAQPYPQFKALIDEELVKANELIKNGVKKSDVYAELTKNGLDKAAAPPPQAPQAPQGRRKVEYSKDDPQEGGKNPKVTIVEFSDFQCPFCSRAAATVTQIKETYKDEIRIVYKNNPLPFHQNANIAAQAALAAHEQGKFWQMHDKMFANQQALDRPSLEKYAKEIGLNMPKFKAALDSGKFKTHIEEESKLANSLGANGTPAFFVDGKLISGAQPFENFKSVIDADMQKADEMLKKGVKRASLYAEFMKEATNAPPPSANNNDENRPADVAVGDSAVLGEAKAPVTIVEFSDFQCPFCGRAIPAIQQVEKEYKDKVKVVFKHNPLPFHANARPAALAAEAAKEQGKFWQMHDKLFSNQQALARENLVSYAKEIGLDVGKFEKSLDAKKGDTQIDKDLADGQKAGVNGTPTFFINGRRLVGAVPAENFKSIIDDELKKASAHATK